MKIGPLWLKLQIACGDALALGPGKADLLDAIAARGSISAAARGMGMSYRRAWLLVDEMNRCFDPPLVETLRGGGLERGARVTETGLAVLEAYREMERDAAAIAERPAYARLRAHLRTLPRAPDNGDATSRTDR
ncbi:molybdate transport system regulatory protein [Sphingomonas trueperi]|uniref:winged helix-turn-helix domain-containing protein n=1 Tax=Sphingomonas trueperi TaxID=53317 RepID=UPI003393E785